MVSAAQIVAGQVEWHAPSMATGTITQAIGFSVVDNYGTGAEDAATNTLTLSRTISAAATFDNSSNSYFEAVSASLNWQQSYDASMASGAHLATFEGNAGNATAIIEAGAGNYYIGLEQSSNALEPAGGWHWSSGNTAITWGAGEPNESGSEDNGMISSSSSGSRVIDVGAIATANYLNEYENAMFIRKGDATLIDLMTGSAKADMMAGLGGADVLSGMAGDDRLIVPDLLFASVNGGAGFDVLEFSAAATIAGATLDTKVTDVEGLHLGTGNQALTLSAANVQGLSSTTDTLYISSSGAGDTLDLTEVIGFGANQWHLTGNTHGVNTYQYFDASNAVTLTRLLIDQTVTII
jgi:hypothetical protein